MSTEYKHEQIDEKNPLFNHYLQYGDIIYDKEANTSFVFEAYAISEEVPSVMLNCIGNDSFIRAINRSILIPYSELINKKIDNGDYRFEINNNPSYKIFKDENKKENLVRFVRVEEFEEYLFKLKYKDGV